jgi:hypothetical protein
MMMEPTFFVSLSSMRLTTILSLIGLIFMESFLAEAARPQPPALSCL